LLYDETGVGLMDFFLNWSSINCVKKHVSDALEPKTVYMYMSCSHVKLSFMIVGYIKYQ